MNGYDRRKTAEGRLPTVDDIQEMQKLWATVEDAELPRLVVTVFDSDLNRALNNVDLQWADANRGIQNARDTIHEVMLGHTSNPRWAGESASELRSQMVRTAVEHNVDLLLKALSAQHSKASWRYFLRLSDKTTQVCGTNASDAIFDWLKVIRKFLDENDLPAAHEATTNMWRRI